MIGCTTDGGVEMTVRDGHNRGHLMVVVRDCVGTYTRTATTPRSKESSASPMWWSRKN